MTKSKEVTRENFENFLAWLSPEKEKVGVEYEKLRRVLTMFFASRRCVFADELADEVINRVTVLVGREVIENKMSYIYGVARNVYLESLRKEKIHVNIEDVNPASKPPVEIDFSNECLDECLGKLSREKRELILGYFLENKQKKIALRRKISEDLQINQTALRMQISRLKNDLARCVKDCMN